MTRQRYLPVLLTFFLTASAAYAEYIQLKSGEVVKGKIVEQTDDMVRIDVGIGIPVTYYVDDIQKISETAIEDRSAVSAEPPEPVIDEEPEYTAPLRPVPVPVTAQPAPPKKEEPPPAPPVKKPAGANTKGREEQFLINQLQSQMESPQKEEARGFKNKEEYLRYQFERQSQFQVEEIKRLLQQFDKKLTAAFEEYVRRNPQMNGLTALFKRRGDPAFLLGILAALYALYCLPIMLIARKFHLSGLMAWIPILQMILFVRMAGKTWLWFFLLFIPLLNVLIGMLLCANLARRLQQPSGLGILMIIPGINLIILWYLAFVRIEESA